MDTSIARTPARKPPAKVATPAAKKQLPENNNSSATNTQANTQRSPLRTRSVNTVPAASNSGQNSASNYEAGNSHARSPAENTKSKQVTKSQSNENEFKISPQNGRHMLLFFRAQGTLLSGKETESTLARKMTIKLDPIGTNGVLDVTHN